MYKIKRKFKIHQTQQNQKDSDIHKYRNTILYKKKVDKDLFFTLNSFLNCISFIRSIVSNF